jgi:hypothetical protein
VSAQFGVDDSWVDGCRTDAAPSMPPVEGNREENVGGFFISDSEKY